ncbi:MAG: serine/threonine protein kinase [Clostridiales bacterium]|nr:serine/threonine protein kinase [Clostridiales bacterium]
MDTKNLCFGCFNAHNGQGPCPRCGFDLATVKHPFIALPIGTILNGRYLTGRVLGVGGFGVTYLAFDMTLEICVAIKEFLPSGIALRDQDRYTMTVSSPEEQPKFDSGASKFLEEARLLAKLRDVPNIVTVQDYFRENNTAYFVMEYIEGVDLMKYTQMRGGKLSYEETLQLTLPIIDSLAHVHAHNLLHRDISPDNIVVMRNGSTRLLDFGAARLAIDTEKSKSIILKHGFAPEEQYRKHGNQGPWSDEYALAATMYLIMTGIMPPDSIERVHDDTLVPPIQLGVQIPQYANDALMKALAVSASERFPDMSSFSEALTGRKAFTPVAYASSDAMAGASYGTSSELPSAGTSLDGNMVQGKTVAMPEEAVNGAPQAAGAQQTTAQQAQQGAQVQPMSTQQMQQAQSAQVGQKVISPSLLNPNQAQQQVAPPTTMTNPVKKKKSIWQRPVTYIVAAAIALVGAGVPTGIYLYQNGYFGEQTESTSKRPRKTTTESTTEETTTESSEYADPTVFEDDTKIMYSDSTRLFSISAPKNYKFENNQGVYTLTRDDSKCIVYTDMLSHYEDERIENLCDFVAVSGSFVREYIENTYHLTDYTLKTEEYQFVRMTGDAFSVMCDANAYLNGDRVDITFVATEARENKGVFLNCAIMPLDEKGMYSSDDWAELQEILGSLTEDSTKVSAYDRYESEKTPKFEFVYPRADVASITSSVVANSIDATDILFNDLDSDKNMIRIVTLGKQKSIADACKKAEQAIGFSVGGYTAVTPVVRTDTDIRVRNYAVQKDGENLNCTVCVLKIGGQYYSVIAVCDDNSLEEVALDFTMIVMSLTA